MTEKLYERDSFLTQFSARVLDCREDRRGFWVELDRTAFFPEGGGQPWDTGMLNGVPVLEVHIKEDRILHLCPQSLEPGTAVEGELDWPRRFDLMQQHSGEHIVSGLAHQKFGCDNVGFHLGTERVTIDLNVELTPEDLIWLEDAANRYIWEDRPVRVTCPPPEELEQISYRSKKALTGQVRLVEFPGADLCACCGTHVSTAGQAGPVKLLSCVKFRSGVRIELVCGGRALAYLGEIFRQNMQISQLLSAKPLETAQAAERLLAENAALKARTAQLEEARFSALAAQCAGIGDVLAVEPGLSPNALRLLADKLAGSCGGRCACASPKPEGGCSYVLAGREGDVRPLAQELNQALAGRGGGKPNFVQGGVSAGPSEFVTFFEVRGFHGL